MSSVSIRRSTLALALGAALLAALAPSASGASSSFSVTACAAADGGTQITVTWSGILADTVAFGVGTNHPRGGLGVIDPLPAATSSGTGTEELGLSQPDTAGGNLFLGGLTRQDQVASKTLHKPRGGWPSC